MEPLWTTNPSVLFDPDYILQLFPLKSMNDVESKNALTRLFILISGVLVYSTGDNRITLFAAAIMLGLFVRHNKPPVRGTGTGTETLTGSSSGTVSIAPPKLPQQAEESAGTTQALGKVFDRLDSKPTLISPSAERVERVSDIKKLKAKAARGTSIRAEYIGDLMTDKDNKIKLMSENPKEMASRSPMLPTQEEKIYSTRPYVRRSTDEFDTLWTGDVGPDKMFFRGKM